MKYFIFDIDGTLIDSSKVDQWAMRTALAEFGYEFTYEQLIFSFGMPGRRALAKLSHSSRAGRADHGALGSTGV